MFYSNSKVIDSEYFKIGVWTEITVVKFEKAFLDCIITVKQGLFKTFFVFTFLSSVKLTKRKLEVNAYYLCITPLTSVLRCDNLSFHKVSLLEKEEELWRTFVCPSV